MDSAKESLDVAYKVSQVLDTGLDRHTLSLLIALCDRGVNPEALAALVRECSSASTSSDPPTNSGGKIGSFSGNGSVPFSSSTSSSRSGLK